MNNYRPDPETNGMSKSHRPPILPEKVSSRWVYYGVKRIFPDVHRHSFTLSQWNSRLELNIDQELSTHRRPVLTIESGIYLLEGLCSLQAAAASDA